MCMGLFSCSISIEKRHYLKGYHIDVVKNNKKKRVVENPVDHVKVFDGEIQKSETVINAWPKQLLVPTVNSFHNDSISKRSDHLTTKKSSLNIKKLVHRKKSDCDLIILKDGTQIEVLIENIGEVELTYKKCNFIDGPLYSLNINKIEVVQLRNGDFFRPKSDSNTSNVSDKTTNGRSGIGEMVLGILAIFFAIFATIMSFFTYPAASLAWAFGTFGFILGIIGTILSAAHMSKENFSKTIVGLILSALAIILFMITVIVLVL